MYIYNNDITLATSQHYIWQPIANKLFSLHCWYYSMVYKKNLFPIDDFHVYTSYTVTNSDKQKHRFSTHIIHITLFLRTFVFDKNEFAFSISISIYSTFHCPIITPYLLPVCIPQRTQDTHGLSYFIELVSHADQTVG